MTDDPNTISEPGEKPSITFDCSVILLVLVASLSQYSIGALYDKTGEQVSGGLPLATLVLFVGVVVAVIRRKKCLLPVPSWVHMVVLCAASLGLLGLSRGDLEAGVKEMIQVAEIFGLSWYLFSIIPKPRLDEVAKGMGIIAAVICLIGIGSAYEYLPFMLSEARWAGLQLVAIPFAVWAFRDKPKRLMALFCLVALVNGVFLKNGGLLLGMAFALPLCTLCLSRTKTWAAVAASVVMVVLASTIPGETRAWDSLNPDFDETYTKRLFVESQAALKTPVYYPVGGGVGRYKETINVVKQYLDDEVSPHENMIPKDSNSQYLLTLVESGWPAAIALFGLLVVIGVNHLSPKKEPIPLGIVIGLSALCLMYAGFFTTILGRGIGVWLGAVIGLATALKPISPNDPKEFFTRLALPVGFIVITAGVMVGFNVGEKNDSHVSRMNQRLRNTLPFTAPFKLTPKTPEPILQIIKADGRVATPEQVIVRVEGEDVLLASGSIKVAKAIDAVGGKALVIPLNSGKAKGKADYTVMIPESGTYRVRFRVYWEDGCSNSLRFVCTSGKQVIASERFKEWHVLNSRKVFELKKGENIVTIENTEDGIKLDHFELVKEPDADQ